jgi:stage II sporulation protein D
VYLGVGGEKPATTKAVADTAGQVVLYGGKVATTYYYSSSGGKTASAADVFGFSVPYLVSRPDPWDKASPYYRWGPVLLGARTLQAKLDAEARVVDATGVATPSGRLRTLTLQTATGSEQVPASVMRTALGLRSTWVTIGVLRLDRPSSGPSSSVEHAPRRNRARARTPRLASSAGRASWADVTR